MTNTVIGKDYRLRAGSPMPTAVKGEFVIHSFKALMSDVIVDNCIDTLPSSIDFQGQGGDFLSASYTRLPLSEERYKGKINNSGEYVEETFGGFN